MAPTREACGLSWLSVRLDDDGWAGAEGVPDGRDVGRVRVDADLAVGGRPAGVGEIGPDDLVRG
jgi:hypothetical protein